MLPQPRDKNLLRDVGGILRIAGYAVTGAVY
jgi:hypothetical protein